MGAVGPARTVDLTFAIDREPCTVFLAGDLEQADATAGADDGEEAVAIFDVLSRFDAYSRALLMKSLANTTTAVPPTNSEREPTLQKPVARSHPAPRRSCGLVSTPADLFGQLRHGI